MFLEYIFIQQEGEMENLYKYDILIQGMNIVNKCWTKYLYLFLHSVQSTPSL